MPSRGIAYHNMPTTSDICAALQNIVSEESEGVFQIVTFTEVIEELGRMYMRDTGSRKTTAVKALIKQWHNTPKSRFLNGARSYEKEMSKLSPNKHRVAVPIRTTSSPIFNGAILTDGEEKVELDKTLTNNGRAIGHAFFTKDSNHRLMTHWLKLRSGQVIGSNDSLVAQIKDASSNPLVKKLERIEKKYNDATIKALPKPKKK